MRRAGRTDDNQTAVVDFLRAASWSVLITSMLGKGAPDAIVARDGFTAALEIKDGDKPPSARKLTKDERRFQLAWQGAYIVAISPEDALSQLTRAYARREK